MVLRCLTILLALALAVSHAEAARAVVELGQRAPELAGVDLNGRAVSLAELNAAGKFVLIDFWAKWCGPCMRELPHVAPFYDEFASERFELIGVSLDTEDTYKDMLAVIADQGLHYPIIYEGGGWQTRLAVEWDIHSIPATFLVNPDGIVVLKNIRGEEGLALVRRIVSEVPDFLPPPVSITAEAQEHLVAARADIAEITVDPHRFTFSIACFVPGESESEEGTWIGGDYTLDLVPQPEGWVLTLTPSPENEGDAPVAVEQEGQYLVFTLASAKPLARGYFELAMFLPVLEAEVALGSFFVEPEAPAEEPPTAGS